MKINKKRGKMKTTHVGAMSPSANITVGKSRLKVENNKVYLKDGIEFEIELFNPTPDDIAAELWINGSKKGESLLVLKPGQRVFLERYLDTNKRFLFETYNVDKGNSSVEAAILKNGLVEIRFYRAEAKKGNHIFITNPIWNQTFTYHPSPTHYNSGSPIVGLTNTGGYYGSTSSGTSNTFNTLGLKGSNGPQGPVGAKGVQGEPGYTTITSAFYNSTNGIGTLTTNMPTMDFLDTNEVEQKETGRVAEGSTSNQHFGTVDTTFSSWPLWIVSVQLLPLSEKIIINESDIKVYCTECGMKKKVNHKFCPKCGTKFE